MIQITAYLQTEHDLAKWKALPNKAQWLHDMLNLDDDCKVLIKSLPQAGNGVQ